MLLQSEISDKLCKFIFVNWHNLNRRFIKHDVGRNRKLATQKVVFFFTAKRHFSTMSVSNLTSAIFAVVKKYTWLACIFTSKISHPKHTRKFGSKRAACNSSCKIVHASFLHGFCVEIHHIACNLCACKCCNALGLYCMLEMWVLKRNVSNIQGKCF